MFLYLPFDLLPFWPFIATSTSFLPNSALVNCLSMKNNCKIQVVGNYEKLDLLTAKYMTVFSSQKSIAK